MGVTMDKMVESCSVTNYCPKLSTISPSTLIISPQQKASHNYIVSKEYKQLIIEIKFKQEIDLAFIIFYTLPVTSNNIRDSDISAPKLVYFYDTSRANINMNDIGSPKPNKIINCSGSQNEETIHLYSRRQGACFSKMQYLTVCIKSNHNNTKHTFLNGVAGWIAPNQELISSTKQQVHDQIKYDNTRYDESIVNALVALGAGTRTNIIKASSMAIDYKNATSVLQKLHELHMYGSLGAAIKYNQQYNKWNCTACTFENNGLTLRCSMCGAAKPNTSISENTAQQQCIKEVLDDYKYDNDDAVDTNANDEQKYDTKDALDANYWECSTCTLHNSDDQSICTLCSTPNPNMLISVNEDAHSHQLVSQLQASHGPSQCPYELKQCPCLRNIIEVINKYHVLNDQIKSFTNSRHIDDDDIDILRSPKHNKKVTLLFKIFKNVMENPNDYKYKNLNLRVIYQKFANCKVCLKLLKTAGFIESDDGKRLLFDTEKMNILQQINNHLQISLTSNSQQVAFTAKQASLFDEIFMNYSEVDLMNDYHHLLYAHDNDAGNIHHCFNMECYDGKCCDISSCNIIRRNHRDRANETSSNMYGTTEVNEVVRLQLMDTIHSQYFHKIFDVEYKTAQNQTAQIEQKLDVDNCNESDPVEKCVSEWTTLTNICMKSYLKPLSNYHKAINKWKNKYAGNNKFIDTVYSYGYRYFYWDYYKTNMDVWDTRTFRVSSKHHREAANQHENGQSYCLYHWYINKAFANLKEEITQNSICVLSPAQFNNELKKAQIKFQSELAKSMRCCTNGREDDYKIFKRSLVRIEHLLAMMLYCNHTLLQSKLTETYRRTDPYEPDDELKKRHSNYANWGCLLRELVECYGWNTEVEQIASNLYHGLNIKCQLRSLHALIKGPLSTTRDINVAKLFCNNEGMVMTMIPDMYMYIPSTHCQAKMDCRWLSDYPYEKEVFFIGGYSGFDIYSIIFPNGDDYSKYCEAICAINCIDITISEFNKRLDESQGSLKDRDQTIFRLISNEMHKHYPNDKQFYAWHELPEFAESLFHANCQNTKTIKLLPGYSEDSLIRKLFKSYFLNENGLIKLTKLTTLFPRLRRIFMDVNCNVTASFDEINRWILDFIATCRSGMLLSTIEIEFSYSTQYFYHAKELNTKYFEEFFNKYWYNGVFKEKGLIILRFGSMTSEFFKHAFGKKAIKGLLNKDKNECCIM